MGLEPTTPRLHAWVLWTLSYEIATHFNIWFGKFVKITSWNAIHTECSNRWAAAAAAADDDDDDGGGGGGGAAADDDDDADDDNYDYIHFVQF